MSACKSWLQTPEGIGGKREEREGGKEKKTMWMRSKDRTYILTVGLSVAVGKTLGAVIM